MQNISSRNGRIRVGPSQRITVIQVTLHTNAAVAWLNSTLPIPVCRSGNRRQVYQGVRQMMA